MSLPIASTQHISQGEFAVSDQAEAVITTVLGSCVAACLWDPVAKVGGMNHILLPDGEGSDLRNSSLGANAMELLINGLIRKGADRAGLQAKVFGGARMIQGLSEIGDRNGRFVTEFLQREGIACVSSSLGGTQGRRIRFWPTTGKAQQLLLVDRWMPSEVLVPPKPPVVPGGQDVELF